MMAFVIVGFVLLVISVIRIKKIQRVYIAKHQNQKAEVKED